jgi:2,3-bisphosphoglycerate-independent phosphoglycerate mutase
MIKYSGPVTLVILDGFGLSDNPVGNAIKAANTPLLDTLFHICPWLKLAASGEAVGLAPGTMGNSEVGHNAMGAGVVVPQGALLVERALDSGAVFKGEEWKKITSNALAPGRTLHFVGLLSDGGVHSNIAHLFKLLDAAAGAGVPRVRVHILLDGRDVAPTSALTYVRALEEKLATFGRDYKIASGGGRMKIVMDRYEADWGMVEKGWRTMVDGEAKGFPSAEAAITAFRAETPGVIDQDLPPFVVADANGKPIGAMNSGDSVILFNFRGDRAEEIAEAFEAGADFKPFKRGDKTFVFASLLEYDHEKHLPRHFLIAAPEFHYTLGEFLAEKGVRQLAISETQKFGHVTYFFNGNHADKFRPELEDYVEVPSLPQPFDAHPEMRAAEITEKLISLLPNNYGFIRVNYPNPDMIGHTGNFDATVKAIEAIDRALTRLLPAIAKADGMAIIIGDHGNAEEMYELNPDGTAKVGADGRPLPKTSHTTNPVPGLFVDATENRARYKVLSAADGAGLADGGFGLTDLASTIAILCGETPRPEWRPPVIKPL